MTYLELCNRIYSHIQSKDVREYYLNEIKGSMMPEPLLFIIRYGFYSIEDKFKDMKALQDIIDISNVTNMMKEIFEEFSIIEKDFYDNSDNIIYSGKFYFELYDKNSILSLMDETFYGKTFEEFVTNINIFKENEYDFSDECTTYGYVEKLHTDKSCRDYIRYSICNIDGVYTIVDGSVINDNNYKFGFRTPQLPAYKYPYKNGDIIVYKTPLMSHPIYGIFDSEIDGNGAYYAFLSYNDKGNTYDIDLADMISVYEGYQPIDWIKKVDVIPNIPVNKAFGKNNLKETTD